MRMNKQTAFARALLAAQSLPPPGLKAWNGSDPARRFAVYRNNVIVSLIDALADTYPVTVQMVGKDFFLAAARGYARLHPPRSPILAHYGEDFGDYLGHLPEAAHLAYMPDLARLEWLYVRAFHAADAEAVTPSAIAATLSTEVLLSEARLGLHPALAVLKTKYAVVSLWAAHQDVLAINDVDPYTPESALIWRAELRVQIQKIDCGAATFISQLQRGAGLQSAANAVLTEDTEFDLAASLALLIRSGAVSSIHTQRTPS
jgi:hypothetical protein